MTYENKGLFGLYQSMRWRYLSCFVFLLPSSTQHGESYTKGSCNLRAHSFFMDCKPNLTLNCIQYFLVLLDTIPSSPRVTTTLSRLKFYLVTSCTVHEWPLSNAWWWRTYDWILPLWVSCKCSNKFWNQQSAHYWSVLVHSFKLLARNFDP